MRRVVSPILATVTIMVMTCNNAVAQSLAENTRVRDGIVHVGMAVELSDKCGSLRPRTIRGIGFLQELKDYARSQGFSDAEIDAYVDNKAEQRRLAALARDQLARLGVVEGQESTYCAVGRDQIARQTRVGWLLR